MSEKKKIDDKIQMIISQDKAIKRGDPLRWVRAGQAALDWYVANPSRDKDGLAIPGKRSELVKALTANGRAVAESTLRDYESVALLYRRARSLFDEGLTIVNLRDLARAFAKTPKFNGSFAIQSVDESPVVDITE